MTPPHDLPAPGRRQALYIVYSTLQSPVFLLNSRYPRFCAPGFSSETRSLITYYRATFSRSYSSILQSSLTRVLSRALEYSSHPPVSVYGTSRHWTHCQDFLASIETHDYRGHYSSRLPLRDNSEADLPTPDPYVVTPTYSRPMFSFSVPRQLITPNAE